MAELAQAVTMKPVKLKRAILIVADELKLKFG
jgi:hypothetical protein